MCLYIHSLKGRSLPAGEVGGIQLGVPAAGGVQPRRPGPRCNGPHSRWSPPPLRYGANLGTGQNFGPTRESFSVRNQGLIFKSGRFMVQMCEEAASLGGPGLSAMARTLAGRNPPIHCRSLD